MEELEYTASEIRKLLQQLFPHRKLVLSQFTFYNQTGVARPTGVTFARGRRRYRLCDLLPIACVLALKEEGIPLKNVTSVPAIIQQNAEKIFHARGACLLSGFGGTLHLQEPEEVTASLALQEFLNCPEQVQLFWSYDVGALARQLQEIAGAQIEIRKAA